MRNAKAGYVQGRVEAIYDAGLQVTVREVHTGLERMVIDPPEELRRIGARVWIARDRAVIEARE